MIARLALALIQASLPATACPAARDEAAMSSALDCMALIAVPGLPAAAGIVALLPAHSPFGVAVTVDGRPRHHLVATVSGLPDPHTLGEFSVFVAWAYTLSLDSAVKLGAVTNGRVELGEIARAQFRILISAERSLAVTARTGRLVLRGTSPSARLLAHRDLLQPAAMGAASDAARGALNAAAHGMAEMHGASLGASGGATPGWAMPPMPSWMPVMPGMTGVVPGTAPFLPAARTSAAIPPVQAHTALRLQSGDTLTLEAAPVTRSVAGRRFTSYAFNGQIPGPLIEVAQGATIVVRFHNSIDLPSAVHWHGVRLDNRFDGAVGVTQEAVQPGETFTYRVHFSDAGLYWYHPHVREDIEQNLGLYGNLLVRSPRADYYSHVNREEVLTLDDILLGADAPSAFGAGSPTHALMGRWGNVLLVNGEPRFALDVKRGEVVRFFLTNVSNARVYNVSFGDARIKLVAGDAGKFEREEWVRSVVIAPAERYVVEVEFPRSGAVAMLNRVQALDHMIGSYAPETDTLGFVNVAPAAIAVRYVRQFETLRQNADVAADLAAIRGQFSKPVDHELTLSLRTRGLPAAVANMLIGINAPMEWNDGMPMANWVTTGGEVTWILRDPATGKENMDIDWRFAAGDVARIRVFNDPASSHAMDHPIHLHGQRFLVLARDGVRNQNLVWKDTAIIPAGATVDLLVDMSNAGRWMLHCHIAEHLGAGMMSTFVVAGSGRQ